MTDLAAFAKRINAGHKGMSSNVGDKLIHCWASELAKIVRKYGRHSKDCQRPLGPECTCGWDEIKREIGA